MSDVVLKQADIFYEFTNTQIALVSSIANERTFEPNTIIFEENTPGDDLFIIADGEVVIQVNPAVLGKDATTGPQTIATLRRGQSFGEVSLVDEGLRSARAKSDADGARLVVIPREKLMRLCDSYPQLGYRLMRNLAADLAMKIRNTDLQVREYLTWSAQQATDSE